MTDTNSICRLCLCTEAVFYLFQKEVDIIEKIKTSCDLEINLQDGLPDHICRICSETLEATTKFREQCHEADRILRNGIKEIEPKGETLIKEEQCDIVDGYIYLDEEVDNDEKSKKNTVIENNTEEYSVHIENDFDTKVNDATKREKNQRRGKIFSCDECPKTFTRKCKLQDHKYSHLGVKLFPCELCDQLFSCRAYVLKHLKCHKRVYACRICKDVFKGIYHLKEHMKSHKKDLFCDMCMNKFGSKQGLSRHISRLHSEDKPKQRIRKKSKAAEEKQTNRQFDKLLLSIDKKTLNNSTLCVECGKYFETKKKYYNHIKSHQKATYSCDNCSKIFKRKAKLQAHMLIHSGSKNTPCNVCGKLFLSKAYLQKHIISCHKESKIIACIICKKKLREKSLKFHMKAHTGEKKFSCEICSKQFMTKTRLRDHVLLHSDEKPYGCQYCSKKFKNKKTKYDHELLHTGETPYQCPVCSKGFAQLSNMKSHFKYNHKGKKLQDYPSYKKRDRRKDQFIA